MSSVVLGLLMTESIVRMFIFSAPFLHGNVLNVLLEFSSVSKEVYLKPKGAAIQQSQAQWFLQGAVVTTQFFGKSV